MKQRIKLNGQWYRVIGRRSDGSLCIQHCSYRRGSAEYTVISPIPSHKPSSARTKEKEFAL